MAIMRAEPTKVDRLSRTQSSGERRTPTSKCTSCNCDRDLFAVERLATRAYVLHTFRCPACASVLRLVVPTGIELDSIDRRRHANRAAHGSRCEGLDRSAGSAASHLEIIDERCGGFDDRISDAVNAFRRELRATIAVSLPATLAQNFLKATLQRPAYGTSIRGPGAPAF
jgi:hypothetical protein